MSSETLRNVVVVGAASAGLCAVQSLVKMLPPSHRVVLVEANPVAFWSIAALRAAVLPGFEHRVIHDLTTSTVFGEGTRHVVLAGTRVVDVQPDCVVVDRDVGSVLPGARGNTIDVDKVILAVGATSVFPTRLSTARTKQDVLAQFQQMQRDIAEAKEVLVLGGGPTGVEFAGEVVDAHPGKKVTLVTRGPGLVTRGKDNFSGMSDRLISQLTAKGVRLIFNDSIALEPGQTTGPLGGTRTFTTRGNQTVQADYIMISSGGKPNTTWIANIDPTLVDSATGLLKVNAAFNFEAPRWRNYYALGDAANTPGPKEGYIAGQHAPLLAHNVVQAIKGQSKLKEAKAPWAEPLVVNVGMYGGAGYLGFVNVGAWIVGWIKGRELHVRLFHSWFKS